MEEVGGCAHLNWLPISGWGLVARGGGVALVGFGNCGCEFRDCGLREVVSINFILAEK